MPQVAFDPLDGSSIVGANFAVGSIFGIWKGEQLLGQKAGNQVAAAYSIYGPKTIFVLACSNGTLSVMNHSLVDHLLCPKQLFQCFANIRNIHESNQQWQSPTYGLLIFMICKDKHAQCVHLWHTCSSYAA